MIRFSWAVEHRIDGSYVNEFENGELKIAYGPMPATATGPFIDECQEKLGDTFDRLLKKRC